MKYSLNPIPIAHFLGLLFKTYEAIIFNIYLIKLKMFQIILMNLNIY